MKWQWSLGGVLIAIVLIAAFLAGFSSAWRRAAARWSRSPKSPPQAPVSQGTGANGPGPATPRAAVDPAERDLEDLKKRYPEVERTFPRLGKEHMPVPEVAPRESKPGDKTLERENFPQ
jgi:hypothetical protein